MRTTTINFREFMDKKERREFGSTTLRSEMKMYSIVGLSPAGFFNMSPLVATGYKIVLFVSAISVLAALLERRSTVRGNIEGARVIAGITAVLVPLMCIGLCFWFGRKALL